MTSSSTQLTHTFINTTDNPAHGRRERRVLVRRTVMSDYHKRRKGPNHAHGAVIGTQAGVTDGDPVIRSFISMQIPVAPGFKGAIGDPTRTPFIPPSPESLATLSEALFQRRHLAHHHHAHLSRLIMGFLRGLPLKAARDVSLVAFIHRTHQWDCKDDNSDDSDDLLSSCREVLRDLVDNVTSTNVWPRIREQQERLYSQIESFNRWRLLSAAQAITLYIMLWLRVPQTHDGFPQGNIALLFTLGKIYKFLQERYLHTNPEGSNMRPIDSWEDWIFQESCLRVATVYFILSLVVDVDIGFACDGPTDWCIEKMPLTAVKAAWEANDADAWREAAGRSINVGMRPTCGDLFNRENTEHLTEDSWEEELDELGLIVAMAGPLHADFSKA